MKIHLFTDKQVNHAFESIKHPMYRAFEMVHESRKAQLDAEVERQKETSEEVAEYKKEREERLERYRKLAEVQKQVQAIHKDYTIDHVGWKNGTVREFFVNFTKAEEAYNEDTQQGIEERAKMIAKNVLGIDKIPFREQCLYDDLKFRIALTGVTPPDELIQKLNEQINIEDYFITL